MNVLEAHKVSSDSALWDGVKYKFSLRKFARLILDPTRVCAIEHTIKTLEGTDEVQDEITEVIPVAGELKDVGGGYLDAKYTWHKDPEREGLRMELNGGFYGTSKRKQKAVVEFLCDPDRTGTETDLDPEDKYEDGEGKSTKGGSSLKVVKYDKDLPEVGILWLEWYTKYACEGQKDEDDATKSGHWGFFTWFLIM